MSRRIVISLLAAVAFTLTACSETSYRFTPEDNPKDESQCGIVTKVDPGAFSAEKTPLGRYCTTTTEVAE